MSSLCPYIPELPYSGFRERLRVKLGSQRIPLSGSLELNFRCNLRCQHCYIAHGHTGIPDKVELSFEEIQRVIDELVEAGCLWLLLTGGEVMMRRDFVDIYLYAKKKGLLVTLFTNATMITERMADMLAEYRPFNLEITLYGWTQETYERVTGIPGSRKRCYEGIQRLKDRGIPFRLKTVLMSLNYHEFDEMQAFAESMGTHFRFDPLINGGIESCGQPTAVRLPPKKVIELELQRPELAQEWRNFMANYQGWTSNDLLYQCGAGLTSFHIDPYGQLTMCLMARQRSYDVRNGSFRQGWDEFLLHERYLKANADRACNSCQLQPMCSSCAGWSFTETGDSNAHVDYLCEVTHLRAETYGINKDLLQPQPALQAAQQQDLIQIQFPVEINDFV